MGHYCGEYILKKRVLTLNMAICAQALYFKNTTATATTATTNNYYYFYYFIVFCYILFLLFQFAIRSKLNVATNDW